MPALTKSIVVVLTMGCWLTASASELFSFWPGKNVEKAPGFQSLSEHPCGQVAHAKVAKLPTGNNGPLLVDIVVEMDKRNRVIQRWPSPVDFVPSAVRGTELLVTAGERRFWVRPNGSFRKASEIPADNQVSAQFKCDLSSVFGRSNYAACSVYVDLASGRKRTLGYQGVCS